MIEIHCASEDCDTWQVTTADDPGFWIPVAWPHEELRFFCSGPCLSRWAAGMEELTESRAL